MKMRGLSFGTAVLLGLLASMALLQATSQARVYQPTGTTPGVNYAIVVSITSPPNNTYVACNKSQAIAAGASDCDQANDGSGWFDIPDDVTSGTTADYHHIEWSMSGGNGVLVNLYGPTTNYNAAGPDGNSVESVQVTATADDTFFAAHEQGASPRDSAASASVTLKVWEVVLSAVRTGGLRDPNNDSDPIYCAWGGSELGPHVLGEATEGCGSDTIEGWFKTIEIEGTVDPGVPTTGGFSWCQWIQGVLKLRSESTQQWVYSAPMGQDSTTWFDDNSPLTHSDGDTTHAGSDVNKIYGMDPPGAHVGGPLLNGKDWYIRQNQFRTYVMRGGVRVSIYREWSFNQEIKKQNGVWTLISQQ